MPTDLSTYLQQIRQRRMQQLQQMLAQQGGQGGVPLQSQSGQPQGPKGSLGALEGIGERGQQLYNWATAPTAMTPVPAGATTVTQPVGATSGIFATPTATLPLAQGVGTGAGAAGAGAGAAGTGAGAAAGGATGGAGGQGLMSILGALFSTRRMKQDISTAVHRGDLRWVHFRYLPSVDPTERWQLGLIAEEVNETHPEWVALDAEGHPLAIHYDRIPEYLWP